MLLAAPLAAACSDASADARTFRASAELLSEANTRVTDAMLDIVTSPPVASRTYAYASVAAYEVLRHGHPEHRSLAGRVNGLETVPAPPAGAALELPLASVVAHLAVAEKLVFAPEKVAAHRAAVITRARRAGVDDSVVARSVAYADRVAAHVLAWAATDGIKAARAAPRYEVRYEPGRWQPTGPAYMDAVEPNWGTLRPFALDSGGQFPPPAPHPFDLREGSAFRREVMAVHDAVVSLTDEQRAVALFWDNNPFALRAEGHIMFADKKISPPAHWLGIAAIALREADADMMRAAESYALLSIALADAFIAVWEAKFRHHVVRPETVIAEEVDPAWRPILQTPPFPEYPSGHSVASAAAAEVLTALLGDGFAFRDDVEQASGVAPRSFRSFRHAAEEAAISRLYGGIHYPMAIEHGLAQGRLIGAEVLETAGTREPVVAEAR